MATILLSAAGAAVGGAVGGTVAGLSTAVIGRAVGATLGKIIDQRIMGPGSQSVETGRVDRFRITNVGEGEAVGQVFGVMRVGGQVVWASDFIETTATTSSGGGGKGASSQPQTRTTSYSYAINLAVALCDGEITRVGRVWADGEEYAPEDLNMRVYSGALDQMPDPTIEAIEGAGQAPAYRGTAYVVFENLQLEQFGNRIPQFSFEVARPEQPGDDDSLDLTRALEAVAIMPGSGEYTLATTPVHYTNGPGSRWSANVNTPASKADFAVSLDNLSHDLPNAKAASLIVSWFGNDLRCGTCTVRPKFEKPENEGENMPWSVAGKTRATGQAMQQVDGNPVYGGTPTDQSVVEAIRALKDNGQDVMFYPFILMDQLEGNSLPDPWSDGTQPHLPWRGRITLAKAPGQPGSTDQSAAANGEVDAFFGTATAADFLVGDGNVTYTGPEEWSFSRFILHYAALCAAAGGVEAFCIGSELRGLTQVRGAGNSFPFVQRLIDLTGEVRSLLGSGTMLSYAADWSEYFGYQPQDGTGDRFFHLDPLWADPEINFVGIDNYMPLSDWRDDAGHLDGQEAPAIHDLDYLRSRIEGGEGFDWYYASPEDRLAQARTPITDAAHNEPWVYRFKDLKGWWGNSHHERVGGTRSANPTGWQPGSKPIWFTEYGCAAIDKGANQPNKFLDPKSSESSLPHYSNGARDDLMQMQYLRAYTSHYADAANNPVSAVYGGPMVDMSRAFVWAWDARPFPAFPNNREQWSDGENHGRGHWISGRTSGRPLSSVVEEICKKAGVGPIDTSRLFGHVRGYMIDRVDSGRAALQPLMLAHGFDAVERDGVLHFRNRAGSDPIAIDPEWIARSDDLDGVLEQERDPDLELSGKVRLQFVQSDGDFAVLAEEATLPDADAQTVAASDVPVSLTRGEGRQIVERWLSESRVSRDRLRFALPPSQFGIGAGDVVSLPARDGQDPQHYRVDRVEQGPHQILEAVRIEPSVYRAADMADDSPVIRPFSRPVPVMPVFLDLPLIRGDEVPHAPYIAATSEPWPGSTALYQSPTDSNYTLNTIVAARSVIGRTKSGLAAAPHGIWDRGAALEVELTSGTLEGAEDAAIFAGANLAAIGDGTSGKWELFQFATADLLAPGCYGLGKRLRGQQGSDAVMPDVWPEGSVFVLLNGVPAQIDLSANLRGVQQHFRIGPAKRGFDDPSYVHLTETFAGIGLRPYAPVHMRQHRDGSGDIRFDWTRRSRIDGDNWDGMVPLGEESEIYQLEVRQGATLIRSVGTTEPSWTYSAADQAEDGVSGASVTVSVAQVSARYGPGAALDANVVL